MIVACLCGEQVARALRGAGAPDEPDETWRSGGSGGTS